MRAIALLSTLALFATAQDPGETAAEADRLFEIATNGSPRIRSQAAARLAKLGEAGTERVRLQLKEPDGYLELGPALYEALVQFEASALRAQVWQTLEDDKNPWRPAGARALAKDPKLEEAARFKALVRDRISAVRAEAIAGVAAGSESDAIQTLTPLLEDSNGRVRRRAATSLAKLGQHSALAWLIEDLRRDDSWFDMRLGRIARAEAAQALGSILGRDAISDYSTRKGPDSEENLAAITGIEERCKALAGDSWPTLPDIALAPSSVEDEALGVELRSCRHGEILLRWTSDDHLIIGEGTTRVLPLPEGTTARLVTHATAALELLADDLSYGDPGCDLERYHIKLPGAARSTTIQLSKGPQAVPDLRPEALHSLAKAMIVSAAEAGLGDRWDELLEVTFESLGGPLPD